MDDMRKRLAATEEFGIDMVADRTKLHHDERIVSILAHDGRRQPQYVSARCGINNGLKRFRRHGMTFIDDYLPVLFYTRIDNALAEKALHQRDVNLPRPPTGTAADLANVFFGDIKK